MPTSTNLTSSKSTLQCLHVVVHIFHGIGSCIIPSASSPPQVDRIWGIQGSCYNIPKAVFYLRKGTISTSTPLPTLMLNTPIVVYYDIQGILKNRGGWGFSIRERGLVPLHCTLKS